MQETRIQSLGQEDPLEREVATHSSIMPGESHGWRSLAGYSPWGCNESGMTVQLTLYDFSHTTRYLSKEVWVFFVASSFAGVVHSFSYIPGGSAPLGVHLAWGLENRKIFWLQEYDLRGNSLPDPWLQNNAARVTAKWRVSPLDLVESVTILTNKELMRFRRLGPDKLWSSLWGFSGLLLGGSSCIKQAPLPRDSTEWVVPLATSGVWERRGLIPPGCPVHPSLGATQGRSVCRQP